MDPSSGKACTELVDHHGTQFEKHQVQPAVIPPEVQVVALQAPTKGTQVKAGAAAEANSRKMEDTLVTHPLSDASCLAANQSWLGAIFDGCDGHEASEYAAANIVRLLQEPVRGGSMEAILTAIPKAFTTLDNDIKELFPKSSGTPEDEESSYWPGSTAVVAALCGSEIVVGNLGDSRALVCGVESSAAKAITRDHTPEDPVEYARLISMGAKVVEVIKNCGQKTLYLGGELNLSRALGAHQLKGGKGLIAEPDMFHYTISESDRLLVLASDGLFEKLSNSQVHEMAMRFYTSSGGDVNACARELVQAAKRSGSQDNISVVVLALGPAPEVVPTPAMEVAAPPPRARNSNSHLFKRAPLVPAAADAPSPCSPPQDGTNSGAAAAAAHTMLDVVTPPAMSDSTGAAAAAIVLKPAEEFQGKGGLADVHPTAPPPAPLMALSESERAAPPMVPPPVVDSKADVTIKVEGAKGAEGGMVPPAVCTLLDGVAPPANSDSTEAAASDNVLKPAGKEAGLPDLHPTATPPVILMTLSESERAAPPVVPLPVVDSEVDITIKLEGSNAAGEGEIPPALCTKTATICATTDDTITTNVLHGAQSQLPASDIAASFTAPDVLGDANVVCTKPTARAAVRTRNPYSMLFKRAPVAFTSDPPVLPGSDTPASGDGDGMSLPADGMTPQPPLMLALMNATPRKAVKDVGMRRPAGRLPWARGLPVWWKVARAVPEAATIPSAALTQADDGEDGRIADTQLAAGFAAVLPAGQSDAIVPASRVDKRQDAQSRNPQTHLAAAIMDELTAAVPLDSTAAALDEASCPDGSLIPTPSPRANDQCCALPSRGRAKRSVHSMASGLRSAVQRMMCCGAKPAVKE